MPKLKRNRKLDSLLNSDTKKRVTIIGRIDGKYHSPTSIYKDSSSAYNLAKEFIKVGWAVKILHGGDKHVKLNTKIYIETIPVSMSLEDKLFYAKNTCKDSDMVIVEGWTSFVPVLKKEQLKKRQVVTIIFRGMKDGFLRSDRVKKTQDVDEIWSVSKNQTELIIKSFNRCEIKHPPVREIGNGINDNVFKINKKIRRIPYKIVYVGALVKEKGVEELINAMEIVVKTFPAARLHIIGDKQLYGNQVGNGINIDKPYIIKYGMLSHKRVSRHFQESNLAVLFSKPELCETFGKSIEEAKACGSRILVSNSGALPERLDENTLGKVVNDLSPSSIAKEIIFQLSQKPLGNMANRTVKRTWKSITSDLINSYYEIIGRYSV